jgi:hypothetical protein
MKTNRRTTLLSVGPLPALSESRCCLNHLDLLDIKATAAAGAPWSLTNDVWSSQIARVHSNSDSAIKLLETEKSGMPRLKTLPSCMRSDGDK